MKYDKIYIMENTVTKKKRIHLLDEIRGLAVFCMIFYHAFFILGDEFGYAWGTRLFDFFMPLEPIFAGLFIAVCGLSCSLSHNNLKRGVIIFAAALALSLVTCVIMPAIGFDGAQIYFGILHLLGVCVIIYALGQKFFNAANPYAGILICAVLYPFFSGIEKGTLSYGELVTVNIPDVLYTVNYLMPLGIYAPWFYSADYFPIFPSIFIFFAGVFTGRILSAKGFPEYTYKKRIPFFDWLGTHAFVIYLAHMPVIYAVAYAVERIINN